MVVYLGTSLFVSPAQTLVNTVNTVGVMGKGIAKEFKSRYPEMFREYRNLCEGRELDVGDLHLWRGEGTWVLNFPTKTTWRRPSKTAYVEQGLQKFISCYQELGITSASFPPLGCGNGNLDWREVQPMMHYYLSKCDIPIYIHNVQVKKGFVAEHIGNHAIGTYADFLSDISEVIRKAGGVFATATETHYEVEIVAPDRIRIKKSDGKNVIIEDEMLGKAYGRLRDSILTKNNFSGSSEQRLRSYLFPILSKLPYVITAKTSSDNSFENATPGLFVERSVAASVSAGRRGPQGCLFR